MSLPKAKRVGDVADRAAALYDELTNLVHECQPKGANERLVFDALLSAEAAMRAAVKPLRAAQEVRS